MKTYRSMKLFGMTLLAPLWLQGCIVVDDRPGYHETPICLGEDCDPYLGEIHFSWGFETESGLATSSCAAAGVAEVDIQIYDSRGRLEFEARNRPCEEAAAVITEFTPGDYDLRLRGICALGRITHEGTFSLDVWAGINDYGRKTLTYLGACL